MTRILITGSSGFVGRNLSAVLEDAGYHTSQVVRTPRTGSELAMSRLYFTKNIDATTDWTDALTEVDVVVHLAAKVHVMDGAEANDLASFRETNVSGTQNLAVQAADSSVKRFIFLSSIKVNGEETGAIPFRADQPPNPQGTYSQSKFEAEQVLRDIEGSSGMEVVIIRPPLVYGPGVKGNMRRLASGVRRGLPLPLGALRNNRDLVSVYNLCDLIRVCCSHPTAGGKTLLVCDGESISTVELIRYISKGLGRKARLFPVPVWLLRLAAGLLGQADKVDRLAGDLRIDSSPTRNTLQWKPPLSVGESFQKMFAEG